MKQSKLLIVLLSTITSLTVLSACTLMTEQSNKEFPLPLNLKAVYWGADVQFPVRGLVIEDDLNVLMVGKESKFLVNRDTVEVEKITKLGIGDYRLLVEVLDTKSDTFYIECIENNTGVTRHDLSLITSDNIDMLNQDSIRWIEADEITKRLK
ncbi:MAG: hypothetical protein AAGI25_16055 [Bacteroidota bacterium]